MVKQSLPLTQECFYNVVCCGLVAVAAGAQRSAFEAAEAAHGGARSDIAAEDSSGG